MAKYSTDKVSAGLNIVESTILKLLAEKCTRPEIAEILDFDPAVALSSLIEKGYLYTDLKIRKEPHHGRNN